MNTSVQSVSLSGLILAFLPTLIVIGVLFRLSLEARIALYGVARMLIQLLLIGYILIYLFNADDPSIIVFVISVMLIAASWIALRPLKNKTPDY